MSLSKVNFSGNPNEAVNSIMEFMDRTGCTVYLINGQRITQAENPGKELQTPGDGCEVYFSHFPKDVREDTLFPLFSEHGKVLQMRLMMHFSGLLKGYGYVVYETKSEANRAISKLNGIKMDGCTLRVCKSLNCRRLFIAGLPNDCHTKCMTDFISTLIDGVTKVTYIKNFKTGDGDNAYCFVDFKSHQLAIKSKSLLRFNLSHELKTPVRVTWARPEIEADEKDLAKVKTMFVRGLAGEFLENYAIENAVKTVIPEEEVLSVRTIRHFAYVSFKSRAATKVAIEILNGKIVNGQKIETVLARPLLRKEI